MARKHHRYVRDQINLGDPIVMVIALLFFALILIVLAFGFGTLGIGPAIRLWMSTELSFPLPT